MRLFFGICSIVMLLTACSLASSEMKEEYTIDNPTAVEILAEDQEADIFQYNNIIYVNASNIEWVQKETYDKGSKVSEIKKKHVNSSQYVDGTASKLPVGTEVFQVKGNGLLILLIEKGNEEIIYLGLVEG